MSVRNPSVSQPASLFGPVGSRRWQKRNGAPRHRATGGTPPCPGSCIVTYRTSACLAAAAAALIATCGWWLARDRGGAAAVGCALPPRDCTGSPAICGALVLFTPSRGPGYEDDPLDDEVAPQDSTSYLRRDLAMLVRHAAARVACAARTWPGNGGPVVLGDMSDRTGAIPGTARGSPRHPPGTHTQGRDIDVGYYQTGTADNRLRPICAHVADGVDHHHCLGAPARLDAARTALFIGMLFESPHVRAVGVDGAAAPALEAALGALCRGGRVTPEACARVRLARETEDRGRGWFYSHHTHLHVSWR